MKILRAIEPIEQFREQGDAVLCDLVDEHHEVAPGALLVVLDQVTRQVSIFMLREEQRRCTRTATLPGPPSRRPRLRHRPPRLWLHRLAPQFPCFDRRSPPFVPVLVLTLGRLG